MIQGCDLEVRYGSKPVVLGISIEIRRGEVVALLGPNGSGKSSLLRALTGEHLPSRGGVMMEDRVLGEWPMEERARHRAVLSQECALDFSFTVLEVVLMGRSPHPGRGESSEDLRIARAALNKAGALELETREYPTLSGGEKRRVQMARVWAQIWERPPSGGRYLFLDEPTANLDLPHQHRVLETAVEFARHGAGVLTVLHDVNLAAQYAHRLILLRQGRVLAQGGAREVLTPEILEHVFETPVAVIPHPEEDLPLVVSLGSKSMPNRNPGTTNRNSSTDTLSSES